MAARTRPAAISGTQAGYSPQVIASPTRPNSKPVFASVTILSFLSSWSSFLWPVMMVDQPRVSPLPLQIAVFQGQEPVNWGEVFAFGVLMVAPVVLVFALFQRWFVRSMANTAIKG